MGLKQQFISVSGLSRSDVTADFDIINNTVTVRWIYIIAGLTCFSSFSHVVVATAALNA